MRKSDKGKRSSIKRGTVCFILIAVILCGTVGGIIHKISADSYDAPAVVLLESMLNGNRKWVLNTIVDDYRYGNPYNTDKSLMYTALSQYENMNDPDYKLTYTVMVDMLTKYYYDNTWEQDLEAFVVDNLTEIATLFVNDAGFFSFANDLKKSAEEERYEEIMFAVFTDTYTSSWGESINEQEASLQQLNEWSDTLKNISELNSYWSKLYGISGSIGEDDTILDFMENVTIPLYESGTDYLKYFNELESREQQVAGSVISLASALSMANWAASCSANYAGETLTGDLLEYVAGENASKLIGGFGDGFELSSGLLSQFTFLNSICHQKGLFYDMLLRMADQAYADGNKKMGLVLEDYAEKMDDAVNENELRYDLLVKALASSDLIKKDLKISSALKAAMPSSWKNAYENSDYGALASVFNIGMSVVDGATGLKNTCLKTYELLYLRDIIKEAKRMYEADLSVYLGSKTEANAQKVLTDLQMLQRLRLRGENIAYKLTKGQLNSWIGRLISGYNSGDWTNLIDEDTDLAEAWKEHYQKSIDCLIGASICPMSYSSFSVNKGEELFIYYDNTKDTFTGAYTAGGKTTYLYEMQYRILSGIEMNGGSLTVKDADVPFIKASGTSTIVIDASTVEVGEITQTGTAKLQIYNGDLELPHTLDLSNAELDGNGNIISTSELTLSNTVKITESSIETEKLSLNKAIVSGGTVTASGDITTGGTSGCNVSSLVLQGNGEQNVTGTIGVGNLTLNNSDNKGIRMNGTFNISGTLTDPENIVTKGLVLTETASIEGDNVASDIVLNGATLSDSITCDRNVIVQTSAVLKGATINGKLEAKNARISNTGGILELKGGLYCENTNIEIGDAIDIYEVAVLNNTTFSGEGPVNLYCDDTVSGQVTSFKNLNICGNWKQVLDIALIAENMTISNTSLLGVELSDTVQITNTLQASGQRIKNGENLILTGSASAEMDGTKSDVKLMNWSGSWEGDLNGTLYLSGTNQIKQQIAAKNGIVQSDGTIQLKGAQLTASGFAQKENTKLYLDENSSIEVTDDAGLMAVVENNGELIVGGDLIVNGTLSGTGTVTAKGNLTLNKDMTFGHLITSGSRKQTISGSDIYVDTYKNYNDSWSGVQIDSQVYVKEMYLNEGRVKGNTPVSVYEESSVISESTSVNGNLTLSDEIIIEEGTELTVSGDVTASDIITVKKNAVLRVKRNLISSANFIVIEEGAQVVINGNLFCDKVTMQVDGTCIVSQDCRLTSGSVSGKGKFIFYGDLINSANFNGLECLELCGRAPQSVSGSALHVNQIILANDSAQGITLSVTLYYKDNLEIADDCCVDKSFLVEETEE